MAAEARRGVPSAVTNDLTAISFPLTRDELRERMSGNLCRCGAHNGIVDAIEANVSRGGRTMRAFEYARPKTASEAVRLMQAQPHAKFLGGEQTLST